MLKLNYIHPEDPERVVETIVDTNMLHFDAWLQSMTSTLPDLNFFFTKTIETTDIF